MLNNVALWGIIKMQIVFQLSLCILLFSILQYNYILLSQHHQVSVSAVDQSRVFEK